MPLLHCTKCHHEWEKSNLEKHFVCDWCHSPGKIIEKETPFERFMKIQDIHEMLYKIQKGK